MKTPNNLLLQNLNIRKVCFGRQSNPSPCFPSEVDSLFFMLFVGYVREISTYLKDNILLIGCIFASSELQHSVLAKKVRCFMTRAGQNGRKQIIILYSFFTNAI
jgi:hypothetical protein